MTIDWLKIKSCDKVKDFSITKSRGPGQEQRLTLKIQLQLSNLGHNLKGSLEKIVVLF